MKRRPLRWWLWSYGLYGAGCLVGYLLLGLSSLGFWAMAVLVPYAVVCGFAGGWLVR